MGAAPDLFRNTTALALDHFRNAEAEIVVLETRTGRASRRDQRDRAGRLGPHPDRLRPSEMARRVLDRNRRPKKPASSSQTSRSFPPCNRKKPRPSSGTRATACAAPLDFVRQPFDRFPIALPRQASQSRTPPWPCPRCTPRESRLTMRRSRAGWRRSYGRRAFSVGTRARSSTAPTIRQAPGY